MQQQLGPEPEATDLILRVLSASRREAVYSQKVTDIFTWLQCSGSFVSVLAPHNPQMITELMVYMSTIIRISQDFSGYAIMLHSNTTQV